MGGLTKLEQETIILFNEAEYEAEVFTFNGALKRRLHTLCEKHPDRFVYDRERSEENGSGGEFFNVPKKYIKVAAPRTMTESQRQQARERARNNLNQDNRK